MTTAQKQTTLTLFTALAVPLLIAAMTLGASRQQLADKEGAKDHELDVARVNARLDLQFVRDSAARAEMRAMLKDVACAQNPQRGYCRGPQ